MSKDITTSDQLNVTALHQAHREFDAQMVQFAGWEMPARYGSALREHQAVRSSAGMFDVSHMGRLYIDGEGAEGLLDRVLTANVRVLEEGQARYCLACREDGGILDDLIVYRLGPEGYLVVCNAANREVILAVIRRSAESVPEASIADRTMETAMIAVQGPRAVETLARISLLAPEALPSFHCTHGDVLGQRMLVARTGYTGEDGVELIMEADAARRLWAALIEAGVTPCGLVARDSLRLEAALRLWGNDMDTSVNPYEVGLGRFVDLNKGDFIGNVALSMVREQGVSKRLVGFEMVGRGIPRNGFPILENDVVIGRVTSGGHSPTLDKNIGLGFVPPSRAEKGTPLTIYIRGRHVQAKVVSLPFYRRTRPECVEGPPPK
ncbi:MAG: glycine cleavage system aminomethyltransferase GcvT [Dehalococcoidia bacterium]